MSETLGILVIVKALGILCVAFIYLSCTKMSTKYLKWKEDKKEHRLKIKVLIINLKTKGNGK